MALMQKYIHLFAEPVRNIGCKSSTRQDKNRRGPPIRKKPYRLPCALKSVVNEKIQDRKNGIIRPSDSL